MNIMFVCTEERSIPVQIELMRLLCLSSYHLQFDLIKNLSFE